MFCIPWSLDYGPRDPEVRRGGAIFPPGWGGGFYVAVLPGVQDGLIRYEYSCVAGVMEETLQPFRGWTHTRFGPIATKVAAVGHPPCLDSATATRAAHKLLLPIVPATLLLYYTSAYL